MHIRAAFEEGACGAIAFAWTDEWWRGGHDVDDWAFGLVDRERRPKPAARGGGRGVRRRAVLARARSATWPRVSVVVCAYNAADTLEDCLQLARAADLSGLRNHPRQRRLDAIARARSRARHPRVRVIDIPNGGLSAARNVGSRRSDRRDRRLHRRRHARRSRLADVSRPAVPHTRTSSAPADRTWCPPTIRRWRSASRARPAARRTCCSTIASPSTCPAATWRSAATRCSRSAASIPIYLRAGDDVDVCWRLQARGWKIGFASAALVWHHHRSSVKAYWRQQVGYGEGETWLMAHHPEKFLDGHMLWRGRIYSPLPFVRSLWGTRINAGVWGTAAFPSVYRTDVHPFAFLPHSIRWQVISFVLTLAGLVVAATGRALRGRRRCCSAAGLVGIAVDDREEHRLRAAIGRRFAARAAGSGIARWSRICISSSRSRALRGQIRGVLSPPEVALPPSERADEPRRRGRRLREAWRALLLISGQRHRGSLLERDLDVGRSRARRSSPTGCGGRARSARSKSTKAGPTIATSACSSAAGRGSTSARSSRSTAAARRCCASARICGRRASASSARSALGAALLVGAAHRRRAALAAGRRDRRGLHARR